MMRSCIIDCYTDEPSGLGVMPYLGTYPRYIFGAMELLGIECFYLTIDDLRSTGASHDLERDVKTKIKLRNTTPNAVNVHRILTTSDFIVVIAGVHTPGKYLSAYPGTTVEAANLLREIMGRSSPMTILTGPGSIWGSGQYGGRHARDVRADLGFFDMIVPELEYRLPGLVKSNFESVEGVEDRFAALGAIAPHGANIVGQLPHSPEFHIAEIETMSGCEKEVPCSFCVEGIDKSPVQRRSAEDIINEVRALSSMGLRNVRIGKQTCIYSYGSSEELDRMLRGVSQYTDVLHIDNANPLFVDEEKTKALLRHCTPGNVASLGVESFDERVIAENDLMTGPEQVLGAIGLINRLGSKRGANGLPMLLPGINLLFGLKGESKATHGENMLWLKRIYDEGLCLRRINIREVVIFPGTKLHSTVGNKFLRKNRMHYWKWRHDIRKNIDYPMLQRLVPTGTVLRGLRTEIYDGNTTFARQIGSYPLVVGIKGRLGLDRKIDASVVGHMLRSVVGEEAKAPSVDLERFPPNSPVE